MFEVVGVIFALALVVVLLPVLLFRMMWRVAEPNEALVISGLRERKPDGVGESLGFKIITGKGTMVMPGIQVVRRLSLDLRETELQIDCVTQQGIPLKVRGVVIYKVGDDYASIANAARRFLDQQNQMDQRVHNVFAGHLRAIVGNMTVEEMIRDREKLTGLTREHAGTEMEKLGLIVDSMQVEETKVAELEAQRAEQRLQVEVRKPADAKAYERTTLAKAERDSQILSAEADARQVELSAAAEAQRIKLAAAADSEQKRMIGDAEASATRARGLAEGEAIKAKGLAEA